MIMIEIVAHSLIVAGETTHIASEQWHHTSQYINYCLKRRYFVSSYVQPIIQQYESTQLSKRTSATKVATKKFTDNFHYEWKPSYTYHKIDTFSCEDGTQRQVLVSPWRMHCMKYGKTHLSGWSGIEQQKNHCRVTQVWRHQAGSCIQSVSQ